MKKHLALAAAAFALVGAAAVPAGSAFAKTKKPPIAAALAIHCGILEEFDKSYDAEILTATGTEKAFLEALEASNDAKITALGCSFVD